MDSLAPWTGPLAPLDLAAVAGMYLLIRLSRHMGMWIYALFALPGTALHEFSHYLVALVLGGKPAWPSLWPVRTERGWLMGEVRFRPGFLRSMLVGVAPLLLAPLAWWWAVAWLAPATMPLYVAHAWIVAALLQACLPSRTDWKLALPALAIIVPLALALAWYLHR